MVDRGRMIPVRHIYVHATLGGRGVGGGWYTPSYICTCNPGGGGGGRGWTVHSIIHMYMHRMYGWIL